MSHIRLSAESARALLYHLDKHGHAADTPCGRAREEVRRELKRDELPSSLAEIDRDGVPDDERPWSMRRFRP